ncbi:MAG: hypothetical protein IJV13_02770 [Prevotella sp.]|nr:hypothetical protein [Prevotella sp.]
MTEEQNKVLKELRQAKEEYDATPGINTVSKEGDALKNFKALVDASGKCWDEIQSKDTNPKDKRELFEEFKKTIAITEE